MNETKEALIIFDVEGTLFDLDHRLHFIQSEQKDWEAFYAASVLDKPVLPMIDLCGNLLNFVSLLDWGKTSEIDPELLEPLFGNVAFVSDTPEYYRSELYTALAWNVLGEEAPKTSIFPPSSSLYMRKDGDDRPEADVKKDILDEIRAKGYSVLFVFEARDKVAKIWRDNGVKCFSLGKE